MGIPRFYRWLKSKYPLIRFQLSDSSKEIPEFDNFYIDFNALVYRCVVEEGTFLRNKIIPLTIAQIYQRVMEYLESLISVITPTKLLFIALDGVAPRAKINQSRDRRFKAGQDSSEFKDLLEKAGIDGKQNFKHNSISPGTQFLVGLCSQLKKFILTKMETEWKHLKVIYSDCSCPGEGQHKIMDFLRTSAENNLFSKDTTHCIYSPDADVILLSLSLELSNISLIKEDTTIFPAPVLSSVARLRQPPRFEMVMINILNEYLEKQFEQSMKEIPNCKIQYIINDFILLMTFVGNDFLPSQFCFTLKDNHMEELYKSYKRFLIQNKTFINNKGEIDWRNVGRILEIATKFQASMIQEKIKNYKANKQNPNYIAAKTQDNAEEQMDQFEVNENKITKGKEYYYKTRFQIQNPNIQTNTELITIIQRYIQGLSFCNLYYFKGLPSWTWFYPYHYTPLLSDVYQYIQSHKVNVKLFQSQPYDPLLALMFMLPESSFYLLPKPIQKALMDPNCPLRHPKDYFPVKFTIDKYQTLKYNKRAIIPFLKDEDVRKVYQSIKRQEYTQQQLARNAKTNSILFYYINDGPKSRLTGVEIPNSKQTQNLLQNIIANKTTFENRRLPSLEIYGKWQLDEKGKLITTHQYKYQNPADVVFFNDFQGYVDDINQCTPQKKFQIQKQYQKLGIVGKCQNYFIVKQCRYTRNLNGFRLIRSRRQVLVPDFALYRVPKYSYLRKTQQLQPKKLYKLGQRVAILNSTNFGFIGVIQKLNEKDLQVRLIQPGYKSRQKLQQLEEDFYTLNYVSQKMGISFEVVLTLLDQIPIYPQFGKKNLKDYMPEGLNFGLGVINQKKRLIVPRYARCQMQYQNNKYSSQIFQKVQISQMCFQILKNYAQKFQWLIDYLENLKQNSTKKNFFFKDIFAKEIFSEDEDPNSKLLSQYTKMFKLKHDGLFCSIYSKTSSQIVQFQPLEKTQNTVLTLKYYEVISKAQAKIAPPALKLQPQYHNIGDRVIYLPSLQTAIVTGIDDNMMYVKLPKKKRSIKVGFMDIFNQKWIQTLEKQDPTSWDLELSYFQPTYWKKAIDIK